MKSALLFAASLVVSITLVEYLLRRFSSQPLNYYRVSRETGHELIPEFEGEFNAEGNSRISISRDGLRDFGHTIPKPKGYFRIALLGDSYAEAVQVSLEDAFHRKLTWLPIFRNMPRKSKFFCTVLKIPGAARGTGTRRVINWRRG